MLLEEDGEILLPFWLFLQNQATSLVSTQSVPLLAKAHLKMDFPFLQREGLIH